MSPIPMNTMPTSYTSRLLVFLLATTLFLPVYFISLPWVMPGIPPAIGFTFPFVVIVVGGSLYLARGRLPSGKKTGYLRSILVTVAIALLSPFLLYILLAIFAPLLQR
jgi:hypothetical protein